MDKIILKKKKVKDVDQYLKLMLTENNPGPYNRRLMKTNFTFKME